MYADFLPHYDQYKHKIFSYLYYRCGRNKEIAEDLTSEVFLKALEKFYTFKKDSSFQSWIYAIAHHHLIDYFRKESGKETVDLEEVDNLLMAEDDVKSALTRRVAAEEVEMLLSHLSDEEREILLLRYHDDLPMKDIAESVGKPEPTIRVTIHRALMKLRNRFAAIYASYFITFFLS